VVATVALGAALVVVPDPTALTIVGVGSYREDVFAVDLHVEQAGSKCSKVYRVEIDRRTSLVHEVENSEEEKESGVMVCVREESSRAREHEGQNLGLGGGTVVLVLDFNRSRFGNDALVRDE
jgi:hypothetical protein